LSSSASTVTTSRARAPRWCCSKGVPRFRVLVVSFRRGSRSTATAAGQLEQRTHGQERDHQVVPQGDSTRRRGPRFCRTRRWRSATCRLSRSATRARTSGPSRGRGGGARGK
jgi:hypothetical protein